MSTTVKDWLKLTGIIVLFSISMVVGGWKPVQTSEAGTLFTLSLIWLVLGALFRSTFEKEQTEKFLNAVLRILLGWGILWLVWYLPMRFPGLKANEYGFEFDLQKSPAVFWMAVAFILGFYQKLIPKIPVAIINRIKKSLGIEEADDIKGNAKHRFLSYWNGLKSMVGDILNR